MKKFSGSRMLVAAGIIALSVATACNNKTNTAAPTANPGGPSTGKIAYVNVDTLQAKYTYWKTKFDELALEESKLTTEIQQSEQQLQNSYQAFQQKAQSGGFASEAEGKAAEQKLAQMNQSIQTRRASAGEQLRAKQMAFQEQLQKNIDEFLAVYTKEHKYDYIMSYTKGAQILYANKTLDITEDVLKGLNEFKPSTSDTATSK